MRLKRKREIKGNIMTSYELLETLKNNKDFKTSIPVDIKRIADLLDIKIIHENFFDLIEPFKFERNGLKYNIIINKFEIQDIKMINYIISLGVMKKCNENNKIEEEELEKYAVKLLTPIEDLNKEIKKFNQKYFLINKKIPSTIELSKHISHKFKIKEEVAKERIIFIEKNTF
jgi:hypothetical protein